MPIVLSQRLRSVAKFVPQNARLLDIGSDHAYLPIALINEKKALFAIAGEVVEGPYKSACHNVLKNGLSDSIEVRLANGLEAFEVSDNISVITICGMGGGLIVDILKADCDKLANVSRLILQPNNREDELRLWLMKNHFKIVMEDIVSENDKYYEILVVEHGEMQLSSRELRFGSFLLKEQSKIFQMRWKHELKKLELALIRVPKHQEIDRHILLQKITAIKEVLHESK